MLPRARGPPVERGSPSQAADEPPSAEPPAAEAAAAEAAATAAAAARAIAAAAAAEAAGVARWGGVDFGPPVIFSPWDRTPVSPPASSSSSSSSSGSRSLPLAEVYLDRLFTGDLCCKLWFTVRREHTRAVLEALTLLLRLALTLQREELNPHLPQGLLDLLVAHAHGDCCLANHKIFWPYPPTLFRVVNNIQLQAVGQGMGDLVVQRSCQLHWGVNLSLGAKAESSNCAASCFWRLCRRCVSALLCGCQSHLLQLILNKLIRERRKAGLSERPYVCWGYHETGCLTAEDLNLGKGGPPTPPTKWRRGPPKRGSGRASRALKGGERTEEGPVGRPNEGPLNLLKEQGAPQAISSSSPSFVAAAAASGGSSCCSRQGESSSCSVPGESCGDRVGGRVSAKEASALGWGRPFNWREIFAANQVDLCVSEWSKLQWSPRSSSSSSSSKRQQTLQQLLRAGHTCSCSPEDKLLRQRREAQLLLLQQRVAFVSKQLEAANASAEKEPKNDLQQQQQRQQPLLQHLKEELKEQQGQLLQQLKPELDQQQQQQQEQVCSGDAAALAALASPQYCCIDSHKGVSVASVSCGVKQAREKTPEGLQLGPLGPPPQMRGDSKGGSLRLSRRALPIDAAGRLSELLVSACSAGGGPPLRVKRRGMRTRAQGPSSGKVEESSSSDAPGPSRDCLRLFRAADPRRLRGAPICLEVDPPWFACPLEHLAVLSPSSRTPLAASTTATGTGRPLPPARGAPQPSPRNGQGAPFRVITRSQLCQKPSNPGGARGVLSEASCAGEACEAPSKGAFLTGSSSEPSALRGPKTLKSSSPAAVGADAVVGKTSATAEARARLQQRQSTQKAGTPRGREGLPRSREGPPKSRGRPPKSKGPLPPSAKLWLQRARAAQASGEPVGFVEFQRMWPVFVRLPPADPAACGCPPGAPSFALPEGAPTGRGPVLLLGMLVEGFHMPLETQEDLHSCLDTVADLAAGRWAPSNKATHKNPSTGGPSTGGLQEISLQQGPLRRDFEKGPSGEDLEALPLEENPREGLGEEALGAPAEGSKPPSGGGVSQNLVGINPVLGAEQKPSRDSWGEDDVIVSEEGPLEEAWGAPVSTTHGLGGPVACAASAAEGPTLRAAAWGAPLEAHGLRAGEGQLKERCAEGPPVEGLPPTVEVQSASGEPAKEGPSETAPCVDDGGPEGPLLRHREEKACGAGGGPCALASARRGQKAWGPPGPHWAVGRLRRGLREQSLSLKRWGLFKARRGAPISLSKRRTLTPLACKHCPPCAFEALSHSPVTRGALGPLLKPPRGRLLEAPSADLLLHRTLLRARQELHKLQGKLHRQQQQQQKQQVLLKQEQQQLLLLKQQQQQQQGPVDLKQDSRSPGESSASKRPHFVRRSRQPVKQEGRQKERLSAAAAVSSSSSRVRRELKGKEVGVVETALPWRWLEASPERDPRALKRCRLQQQQQRQQQQQQRQQQQQQREEQLQHRKQQLEQRQERWLRRSAVRLQQLQAGEALSLPLKRERGQGAPLGGLPSPLSVGPPEHGILSTCSLGGPSGAPSPSDGTGSASQIQTQLVLGAPSRVEEVKEEEVQGGPLAAASGAPPAAAEEEAEDLQVNYGPAAAAVAAAASAAPAASGSPENTSHVKREASPVAASDGTEGPSAADAAAAAKSSSLSGQEVQDLSPPIGCSACSSPRAPAAIAAAAAAGLAAAAAGSAAGAAGSAAAAAGSGDLDAFVPARATPSSPQEQQRAAAAFAAVAATAAASSCGEEEGAARAAATAAKTSAEAAAAAETEVALSPTTGAEAAFAAAAAVGAKATAAAAEPAGALEGPEPPEPSATATDATATEDAAEAAAASHHAAAEGTAEAAEAAEAAAASQAPAAAEAPATETPAGAAEAAAAEAGAPDPAAEAPASNAAAVQATTEKPEASEAPSEPAAAAAAAAADAAAVDAAAEISASVAAAEAAAATGGAAAGGAAEAAAAKGAVAGATAAADAAADVSGALDGRSCSSSARSRSRRAARVSASRGLASEGPPKEGAALSVLGGSLSKAKDAVRMRRAASGAPLREQVEGGPCGKRPRANLQKSIRAKPPAAAAAAGGAGDATAAAAGDAAAAADGSSEGARGPRPECLLHSACNSSPDAAYVEETLERMQFVLQEVWPWTAAKVHNWGEKLDGRRFRRKAAAQALVEGFIPYVVTNFASTCGREAQLRHLDMSYPGKDSIPFWGFPPKARARLGSGIGHSFLYLSVFPGSTFCLHCEQGGLGAFNVVVGALADLIKNTLPAAHQPASSTRPRPAAAAPPAPASAAAAPAVAAAAVEGRSLMQPIRGGRPPALGLKEGGPLH
ncbi:hypothetical protein Esti_006829 [Eimeria stiedai]